MGQGIPIDSQIENRCPLCKERFGRVEKVLRRRSYREKGKSREGREAVEVGNRDQEGQVQFSADDLTLELLEIMETEPDLWNLLLLLAAS